MVRPRVTTQINSLIGEYSPLRIAPRAKALESAFTECYASLPARLAPPSK
jgi:hypothetical protein